MRQNEKLFPKVEERNKKIRRRKQNLNEVRIEKQSRMEKQEIKEEMEE